MEPSSTSVARTTIGGGDGDRRRGWPATSGEDARRGRGSTRGRGYGDLRGEGRTCAKGMNRGRKKHDLGIRIQRLGGPNPTARARLAESLGQRAGAYQRP